MKILLIIYYYINLDNQNVTVNLVRFQTPDSLAHIMREIIWAAMEGGIGLFFLMICTFILIIRYLPWYEMNQGIIKELGHLTVFVLFL